MKVHSIIKSFSILFLIISLSSCSLVYPSYDSPNFNGDRFHNFFPMEYPGILGLLVWRMTRDPEKWPTTIPVQQRVPTMNRVLTEDLQVTYIGHATILIQIGGINIITDPIFSQRASPVSFLGPKRVREPGVAFENLPPIDVVLISHNHYDHMDLETLIRLRKRDNPLIVTGLGNDFWLKRNGFDRTIGLDWHQSIQKSGLEIKFLPTQHWSARGITDRQKSLWGSFSIVSNSRKLFFAGDTGYASFFADIGNEFNGFDLAILPIGAYKPRWFMEAQHIDPAQAIQLHLDLKAKISMAMHFGTFALADDGINEAAEDLKKAMAKENIKNSSFFIPEFGMTYEF